MTTQPPLKLLQLRQALDKHDDRLPDVFHGRLRQLDWLEDRFAITRGISEIKALYGLPPFDAARDAQVEERVAGMALEAGLDPLMVCEFHRQVRALTVAEHERYAAAYVQAIGGAAVAGPEESEPTPFEFPQREP